MKLRILLFIFSCSVVGCGQGYVVAPGRIGVRAETPISRDAVVAEISRVLTSEGFEDLGRYDAMIDLIQKSAQNDTMKQEQLARLGREHSYLNDKRALSVVVTDYSGAESNSFRGPYDAPFKNFLELAVYESRPGGFSPAGREIFGRILIKLRTKRSLDVVTINEPPPTDEKEFSRVTRINRLTSFAAWLVTFAVSVLLIAPPIYLTTCKLNVSRSVRMIIFVLLCTWLITPIPVEATIAIVPLPNIVLFPWLDVSRYLDYGLVVPGSFVATLLLSAAMARRVFRGFEKDGVKPHVPS